MEKLEKVIVWFCILFAIGCMGYLIGHVIYKDAVAYGIVESEQEVELYYFSINGCFACELQKPIIMQLKTQGFNFKIINATYPTPEVQLLLDKYAVTKYPTIIIVTNDNRVIRIVGFRPLKVIKELL